jgi:hypothetical protein
MLKRFDFSSNSRVAGNYRGSAESAGLKRGASGYSLCVVIAVKFIWSSGCSLKGRCSVGRIERGGADDEAVSGRLLCPVYIFPGKVSERGSRKSGRGLGGLNNGNRREACYTRNGPVAGGMRFKICTATLVATP